jgi:hypothetical protein
MKITLEKIPELTIDEYAEKHGLEMVVRERPLPEGVPIRFYANFKNSEVKGFGVLIGKFGNGATPEEAIANYGKEIHLETLVIDAGYSDKRKEIPPTRIKS